MGLTVRDAFRAWRKAMRFLVVMNIAIFFLVSVLVGLLCVGYVNGDYGLFSAAFFMSLCLASLGLGLLALIYSFMGMSFVLCMVIGTLPTPLVVFTAFSTRSWMFAGVPFWLRTLGISLGFAGMLLGITGWVRMGKELGILEGGEG